LGCIDHSAYFENSKYWLHKHICKSAHKVLGVDYEKEEIKKLTRKGYNIICQNVENLNLNRKFDVIIAGELIEHLDNPGLFLDKVKSHLKKDGVLILTTPNSNSIINFIEVIVFGQVAINPEHKLWHNYSTLKQLLINKGFRISKFYYISPPNTHFYKGVKKTVIYLRYILQKIVVTFRKDFSSNLLCIAKIDTTIKGK
jgi:2-polyprenyl-3-methyl-5-hydroxy-6-metoxy-1,4-benzoquinol methylase